MVDKPNNDDNPSNDDETYDASLTHSLFGESPAKESSPKEDNLLDIPSDDSDILEALGRTPTTMDIDPPVPPVAEESHNIVEILPPSPTNLRKTSSKTPPPPIPNDDITMAISSSKIDMLKAFISSETPPTTLLSSKSPPPFSPRDTMTLSSHIADDPVVAPEHTSEKGDDDSSDLKIMDEHPAPAPGRSCATRLPSPSLQNREREHKALSEMFISILKTDGVLNAITEAAAAKSFDSQMYNMALLHSKQETILDALSVMGVAMSLMVRGCLFCAGDKEATAHLSGPEMMTHIKEHFTTKRKAEEDEEDEEEEIDDKWGVPGEFLRSREDPGFDKRARKLMIGTQRNYGCWTQTTLVQHHNRRLST
jgi:hypothetical protein